MMRRDEKTVVGIHGLLSLLAVSSQKFVLVEERSMGQVHRILEESV